MIFLVEMLSKMYALGFLGYFRDAEGGCNICKDGELRWRLFEFLLVSSAWLEVAIALGSKGSKLAFFRLLRLCRITRIIRVCRLSFFADLMMMLNGAVGGARALVW